jgi:D-psicose/D-tagatose/L-ribulose 3-epimerase
MTDQSRGNRLGVHSFVWAGDWTREGCELAVARTKEAGFDLIEVSGMTPERIDAAHTRVELERAGLGATVTLGLARRADINSEDLERVEAGRRVLLDALALTKNVGSDFLGGVIFSALHKYDAPTTGRARENSAAVIREVAQEAAKDGIRIGLEFVNRYESNLLNTTQQTLDYIDLVGESNVYVHADVFHMNIEEQDFRSPVLAAGDRLGYVHIGESHRGYLGTGTIDFAEFFGALAEIGYQGDITFESFSSVILDEQLTVALCVWRDLWGDGMDLATKARVFIEQQLAAVR